jgi:hypothetical protein
MENKIEKKYLQKVKDEITRQRNIKIPKSFMRHWDTVAKKTLEISLDELEKIIDEGLEQ